MQAEEKAHYLMFARFQPSKQLNGLPVCLNTVQTKANSPQNYGIIYVAKKLQEIPKEPQLAVNKTCCCNRKWTDVLPSNV